jgi:predicted esterase
LAGHSDFYFRLDDQIFRDKSTASPDEIEAEIADAVLSIHCLIKKEIQKGISPERIVLAGLSQGGAMALWAGLTFAEGRLGGICALASRLPAKELVQAVRRSEGKTRSHVP